MPRRAAVTRHLDSAPRQEGAWPPQGGALVDALVALHHPARRRLYELLLIEGPASVGELAKRSGLAPGSVSHHMKPLHRSGFVEPDPRLARDTRQSWWRAVSRSLAWESEVFQPGTAAYQVGLLAEYANVAHQNQATVQWMRTREQLPSSWRNAFLVQDSFVRATPEQSEELSSRLQQVITDWRLDCLASEKTEPSPPDRRPVRVVVRIFPSDPGPAS